MAPDRPLGRGSVLAGRYELRSVLGRGGAATVWRAVDRVLEREVAVKVLHPEFATDPTARARFVTEGTSAARLAHPNVVAVYDVGRDEAGRDHLVMELVEGPRLADLLDAGPLDPGVVALLGRDIGSALDAAHTRGMVHRDIKPGNVLLTGDGHAKVADLGLARTLGDTTTRLTMPGTVVGSARYVAPEQLRDEPPDARADLYSLGLVLYEALTGLPPFGEGSVVEVAARRLTEDLEPAAVLRPDAPPALTAAIDRAIQRDPGHRQQDAAALVRGVTPLVDPQARARLAELARGRAPSPPTGRPGRAPAAGAPAAGAPATGPAPGPVVRGGRGRRRWPALVLLAAVLAAAVVVGRLDRPGPGGPAVAVEIVAAGDHDPLGDGREHPDRVPNAIDGDPATAWTTERYVRADLLPPDKDGVGLWLDLGRAVDVRDLTLQLTAPGADLTVFAGDQPPAADTDPRDWGTEVARVERAAATVSLQPTEGVRARVWLLWFTALPPVEGGHQVGIRVIDVHGR